MVPVHVGQTWSTGTMVVSVGGVRLVFVVVGVVVLVADRCRVEFQEEGLERF